MAAIGRPPISIATRFWSKVSKTGACWLWTGALDKDGYGHIWTGKRSPSANRISYEINIGPIPAGMSVCHTCDNPQCVNPAHLFLGTNLDNINDRIQKSRCARGARVGNSKLTDNIVEQIKEKFNTGSAMSNIAKEFNLQLQHVRLIVKSKIWKHIK